MGVVGWLVRRSWQCWSPHVSGCAVVMVLLMSVARALQALQRVMPRVRVLYVMLRVAVPLVMQMVGLLPLMLRVLVPLMMLVARALQVVPGWMLSLVMF